ncbi:electron transport complex subunit RsxG [Sesbania bispinosa]|nr:electron transport complex subunit RsxG [Sesbania bispinosa]
MEKRCAGGDEICNCTKTKKFANIRTGRRRIFHTQKGRTNRDSPAHRQQREELRRSTACKLRCGYDEASVAAAKNLQSERFLLCG